METRHNLGDDAIRHAVPVQFLLHLVGGARAGSEVLHGHGLGCHELLGCCQVHLLLGAQRPPYPQPPCPHDLLGDFAGQHPIQEHCDPGWLGRLDGQMCNGACSLTGAQWLVNSQTLPCS